jgi:hypothetical protein
MNVSVVKKLHLSLRPVRFGTSSQLFQQRVQLLVGKIIDGDPASPIFIVFHGHPGTELGQEALFDVA